MKAADVMESHVVSVRPDTTVCDVARELVARKISAVPVLEDGGRLVGIVSEGDLIRRVEAGTERHRSWWLELLTSSEKLATDYVKSHARYAGEVMTREVVTVREDTPLAEVAKLFEQHNIKRVPVVRDGKVVGIVGRADLLHVLADLHSKSHPVLDDAGIRAEILRQLKSEHWFSSAQIEISVRDRVVKIEGIVMSQEQRRAIEVAAENVPGVKSVNDQTMLKLKVGE
ncbi:MAG TPA: CBS domain-containing protein [Xanthobacteraceae bacterium]|jgi:CBS domain-containing protein